MDATTSCKLASSDAAESIEGTAGFITTWLLLEVPGILGSDAWQEAGIPQPVKSHMDHLIESTPNSGLLLIRKKSNDATLRVMISHTTTCSTQNHFLEASLASYDDLLRLTSLKLEEAVNFGFTHSSKSVILVCTNGRRDPCCSLYALPVYRALSKNSDFNVYESSHLGQHRFAPNILCFPGGILHGRVELAEIEGFAQNISSYGLSPRHLRGRTSFPKPAQAVEAWLYRQRHITPGAELFLTGCESAGDQTWRISFKSNEVQFTVDASYRTQNVRLLSSCGGTKMHNPGDYIIDNMTKETLQ